MTTADGQPQVRPEPPGAAALTGPSQWTLDAARSSVTLRHKTMWGLSTVRGAFGELAGQADIGADGSARGRLEIGAASLDTGNAKRDKHLRSADFFDAARHPDITFTADGVRPSAQGVAVTGMLTVRDRTRPVSFEAAASVPGDGEIWLDAEIDVNRADFGITWNLLGAVSMYNTLTVHAVFTRR